MRRALVAAALAPALVLTLADEASAPAAPVVRSVVDLAEPTTTTTTTLPPAPPPPSTTTTHPPSPPSPPEPTPPPVSVRAGACAGWEATIAAHFPAEQVGKACAVMLCETGGTGSPTIHNPSSSASGLFQFLDSTWRSVTGTTPPAAAHPAEAQVAAAASLWRSSGWGAWSCA